MDLGEREPGVGQVGDLGEERVVAAGGLRAALDDVAGGDGAGQRVVVGAGPAEVGGGGPDDERRVGDPAGDDDVGAGVEAVGDAPRPEVGVGGQRRAPKPEFGSAAPATRSSPSTWATLTVRPSRSASARTAVGQPRRVEPAGVGDDPHAAVQREAEAVLELAEERLRVAAVGSFTGRGRGSAWSARRGSRR